jgi:hypothetical protein
VSLSSLGTAILAGVKHPGDVLGVFSIGSPIDLREIFNFIGVSLPGIKMPEQYQALKKCKDMKISPLPFFALLCLKFHAFYLFNFKGTPLSNFETICIFKETMAKCGKSGRLNRRVRPYR